MGLEAHRFVKEALVGAFVLSARAIEEAVAKRTVVDTAVAAAEIGCGARKALHTIVGTRALCRKKSHVMSKYWCLELKLITRLSEKGWDGMDTRGDVK